MSARQDLIDDGVCTLATVPTALTEALCQALSRWQHSAPPSHNAYGILQHNIWQQIPEFQEAMRSGPFGEMAAEVLGERVVLFQDNLIWKPPGTTDRVQWHQDYAYWPLSAPRGLTMWVALDDVDVDNGCLHYIPGSHTLGERQPTNFVSPGSPSEGSELPPLDWQQREDEARAMPLSAGDVIAHHPLTWHMSPPNLSRRHRRAWSLTWITEDVCWDTTHAPHPFNYFLAPVNGTPLRGDCFPRFSCFPGGPS
jgi:ectoine hydroxylase-related dioxygenase (phytanoyl-CoA dioxygenase family)